MSVKQNGPTRGPVKSSSFRRSFEPKLGPYRGTDKRVQIKTNLRQDLIFENAKMKKKEK
jgi:hypothetical protein